MGLFKSTRIIPLTADLTPVVERVKTYFALQGYQVESTPSLGGSWHISLTKGGTFKAVLGLQTALNIEVQPTSIGTMVTATVGIFGRQVIPSLIARFYAWPVMLTQISGLVQQAKLDEEVLNCVEEALRLQAGAVSAGVPAAGAPATRAPVFCTSCGRPVESSARFCAECGMKVA